MLRDAMPTVRYTALDHNGNTIFAASVRPGESHDEAWHAAWRAIKTSDDNYRAALGGVRM